MGTRVRKEQGHQTAYTGHPKKRSWTGPHARCLFLWFPPFSQVPLLLTEPLLPHGHPFWLVSLSWALSCHPRWLTNSEQSREEKGEGEVGGDCRRTGESVLQVMGMALIETAVMISQMQTYMSELITLYTFHKCKLLYVDQTSSYKQKLPANIFNLQL